MAERRGGRHPDGGRPGGRDGESIELRRLRRRIDALDRRIVALLNERAALGREVGRAKAAAGRRAVRDAEREREVLLRVTMANEGPLPQAELLSIYRRIIAATRVLEARDRAAPSFGPGGGAASDAAASDAPDAGAPDAGASREGPATAPEAPVDDGGR